ncbi:O-methyltransferase [Thozetella sp. PMI_491]|nr:O-methyltransferase [Thozetella sp. PMI_491]
MPPSVTVSSLSAAISGSLGVLQLLEELHARALGEEAYVSTDGHPQSFALDKFVALDPDKCELVYLLLRSSGARYVVEAGTSFGLSTIYLALAVGQNASGAAGTAKVIATENEPTKAAVAREHWRRAGLEVEPWIELREGDLRETLKSDMPAEVDFLLLDIWTPLALPALQATEPYLKRGAMIVADNNVAAKKGYADLVDYVNRPGSGFKSTSLPFSGGLLLIVYVGKD